MSGSVEFNQNFLESRSLSLFAERGVYLLGIGFDGTTSFRPGARFGPQGVRQGSFGIETYSPYLHRDLEDVAFYDSGDLPFTPSRIETVFDLFEQNTKGFNSSKHRLVTIGGEHSISYAPISLYLKNFPELIVIHLDAHADLRDGYLGEPYSHASVIRRVSDLMQDPAKQLIQYGIRSGTKEEFSWMREHKTRCESLQELLQRVSALDETTPIYLTLDFDYFDPAYLPGTGTPEAGGETFHSLITLLKVLAKKNFVGADVVELAPMLDATQNSNAFAAKTLREVVLSLRGVI